MRRCRNRRQRDGPAGRHQEVRRRHPALWVAAPTTTNDLRFGPEIVKSAVESYRKMRNSLRWMLGNARTLQRRTCRCRRPSMPELERYMLHRLSELDAEVRGATPPTTIKRRRLGAAPFMNTDLSAFYFDIRKDALYCEAHSSVKRRRPALTVHRPDLPAA
jgi:isoleucyl-tRNA synthetase